MSKKHPAAQVFNALLNLARLRIVGMVIVACAIGFIVAYRGQFQVLLLMWTLVGTALLNSGACALNCYFERERDALMTRTCQRPLPAGVIAPTIAFSFGVSLVLVGAILLFWKVNMLAGILGLTAVFIYLAIYIPAKRVTWWNTSIGAVPGAIPPLIGWAAARGQIDFGGWVLFAMLFIWQHTHFLPIAWLYKNDYEAAGFRMLPVLEATGQKTFRLTLVTAVILMPVSLLLCDSSLTGTAYFLSAILFDVLLIGAGLNLSRHPSRTSAQTVLFLSLCYLPAILAAVVVDRYGNVFGIHVHAWLETVCRWT